MTEWFDWFEFRYALYVLLTVQLLLLGLSGTLTFNVHRRHGVAPANFASIFLAEWTKLMSRPIAKVGLAFALLLGIVIPPFVYLGNVGGRQFQPASLSRDNLAVWLSIEAADVNGDERPDIVLGLGDWPKFTPKDWTTREIMQGRGPDVPSIMYLLNRH